MAKVYLDYCDGRYLATVLSEEEIYEYESAGARLITIPDEKAKEWEELQIKNREWYIYWRNIDNEK